MVHAVGLLFHPSKTARLPLAREFSLGAAEPVPTKFYLLTMSFFMPLVMPSMESWYMSKCFSSSSKVWVQ